MDVLGLYSLYKKNPHKKTLVTPKGELTKASEEQVNDQTNHADNFI
jgi:hypothetical protein